MLTACLLLLALAVPSAGAEARPRMILLTVYQQMGWGDRIDAGCVDEQGNLWTMTGSASALKWPGDLESQLDYLRNTERLEPAGTLGSGALFDLKGLVLSADPQEVKAIPAANDAGTEISYALRYSADGGLTAVRLGMSGDDVYENTDPDAQALYAALRELFPGVTCYGGTMGPAGFRPVPVSAFLGLDADLIRGAEMRVFLIDCEAGPAEADTADESLRDIVLNRSVTGKVSASAVTGGITSVGFYDAGGNFLGGYDLYEGLLLTGDGMYRIR